MSSKVIETQAILECLDRAVEKALDRKRRLGQYAVIWEEGQIKELRFDEKDSKGNTADGITDTHGLG
ncbi:MAG: hypothetical protein HOH33_15010 [Verrucomicrobia bacterium]|jgi:hypothetical protein|nr:hypothetical protein [Verrucomicrobiota bacterium]